MESEYIYRKEGDEYVIYHEGEYVFTPQGNKISTKNKNLASAMAKAMTKGEEISDAKSILCFHFTVLDSKKDEEEIMQEDIEIPFEVLMNDPYLMFRQPSPIRQLIAQYFSENLPAMLSKLPFHKKLAFFTMARSCNTNMLPFYILHDIVGEDDVKACKESFFEDMEEYLEDFFDTKKEAKAFLKRITPVINTYVKYMSYDEV